ncbi:amidophosphoribosyltransferase [Candidatus Cyanaurora vandensis]|uniref:amidophosphoribosyltransferase n=1 Tax=Candidatus Cyanaurora vandensis TaxID=2714958 RepID=UPI0025803F7A|nr:amidophosphoribosyltransferase [Candidatus Cyanaurora vandensis]
MDQRPDKPREACGVFGVYSPQLNVARLTYFGLFALQHRGQESAGIVTYDYTDQTQKTVIVHEHRSLGLVAQIFDEETIKRLTGYLAVGHNRYSTTGSNRSCNTQPIIIETKRGTLALAHNGNLVNADTLKAGLVERKRPLVGTTDSEEIGQLIAEAVDAGGDWIESTIQAVRVCQGAFSLVIGTPTGLMGVRDSYGVRPLVIGRLEKEYVLASETCALDILGAQYERDVKPGELVWIDDQGLRSCFWTEPTPKLCIFEMIYFARPDSQFYGESLYRYRTRLGETLAQEAPLDVDLVIGVPDSGLPAAIGYARQLGLTYTDGLIKNRYVARTFIQPTQEMREEGLKMKLNPISDILQGKRVAMVDDSIVRGTTSRKIVKALRDAGATEVHMLVSSPPVTHPCFYGIDTDSQDQLIAATKSVAEIAAHLGVDSLHYLSHEGMMRTTHQDPEGFCSACFTGDYPITIPSGIRRSKLILENSVPTAPALGQGRMGN